MKKSFNLLGIALFFFSVTIAQSNNAILFTENGEKFQIILNGILQNQTPETNVKMTHLVADQYKCRILFAEAKLGYLDFNMFFTEMGTEVTWNIKQNNKGQYVTRYISGVPIAEAPTAAPSQTVVVYTTVAPIMVTGAGTSTTTTTHTQSTTSNGNSDNVNIHLGMNMGVEGGNINVNASGMGLDNDGGSSTTTTTTTSHSSTTTTNIGGAVYNTPSQATTVVYVSGYNGKIGCPIPMSPQDFSDFKESVRSKDFEQTKLTIAKQVLENNCLTASQVKEVLGVFDFENSKLEYAKYAYDHTYDIGNYYKVNDAFEFESSVSDLNKYISSRH